MLSSTGRFRSGPGSLDVNLLANFTDSYEVQLLEGSAWQEFAGTIDGTQNGGIPIARLEDADVVDVSAAELRRWRSLAASAEDGRHDFGDAAGEPGGRRADYDLFDATLAYRLNESFLFRGGVNNVLDEEPPIVGGTIGQTQPGTYDIIGRYYYLGLQLNF